MINNEKREDRVFKSGRGSQKEKNKSFVEELARDFLKRTLQFTVSQ